MGHQQQNPKPCLAGRHNCDTLKIGPPAKNGFGVPIGVQLFTTQEKNRALPKRLESMKYSTTPAPKASPSNDVASPEGRGGGGWRHLVRPLSKIRGPKGTKGPKVTKLNLTGTVKSMICKLQTIPLRGLSAFRLGAEKRVRGSKPSNPNKRTPAQAHGKRSRVPSVPTAPWVQHERFVKTGGCQRNNGEVVSILVPKVTCMSPWTEVCRSCGLL